MTEDKEMQHPDELFRQAFEVLPPTSASSGWDKPSERVWEGIRSRIEATPPQPLPQGSVTWRILGWSVVIGALTVVLLVWFRPSIDQVERAPLQAPVDERPMPVANAAPGGTSASVPPLIPHAEAPEPNRLPTAPTSRPATAPLVSSQAVPDIADLPAEEARRAEQFEVDKPKNTAELRRLALKKISTEAWIRPLDPLPVAPAPVGQ